MFNLISRIIDDLLVWIGHGMKPSQQIDIARHNAEKYGTIWKEKFPGGITLVSTTSVQDSEKLFRAESKYPNRPSLDALLKYRSDNKDKYNSAGIVANGKGWWDVRSISQQILLKPKTINKYIPSIGQISDEFVDRFLYHYYFRYLNVYFKLNLHLEIEEKKRAI